MEVQDNHIPNLQNVPIITGQPVQTNNQIILTKINADIESKKHVCIHWCLFFILVSLFIFISFLMPESTKFVKFDNPCDQNSESKFGQESQFIENRYIVCNQSETGYQVIRKLNKENQFLIIYGQFSFLGPSGYELTYINYTATLFGLTKDQKYFSENFITSKNHSITSNCNQNFEDEDEDEYSDEDEYEDESSDHKICDQTVLVYIPILDYDDYLLIIEYSKLIDPYHYVKLKLTGITVDPRYSNSVLILRYIFFGFSIITCTLFVIRMKKLAIQNWVIEQKFVSLLSFLLLWFNDPLFAATLLIPNRITAIIGVIFFSNFICCLFLYWLVLYHRIVIENGTLHSNALTKPKIVICVLLWLFFVVSYSILVIQYFKDPTTSFDDLHHRAYLIFKLLSILFSFAIFLYLLKYLISFCKCYETRLWRYKLIGLFNIFFMMSLGLFIFSGSFEIYNFTGTEVLISICILNLYIFYQQYLWSPSKQGLIQQENLNQNVLINNNDYDELEMDNININQENVVDEKFQAQDEKAIMAE